MSSLFFGENSGGALKPGVRPFLWALGPCVSGILLALSFPMYDQAWLGWVGLIPLLLAAGSLRPWQAFLSGWLGGIVFFLLVFPWIHEVRAIERLATGIGYVYLGAYWGLFSLCLSVAQRRGGLSVYAAAPLWVGMEVLRSHAGFLGFPWALLSHSQVACLPVLQGVSLYGAHGLTLLMVLVNALGAEVVCLVPARRRPTGRTQGAFHRGMALGVLLTLGLCLGFGAWTLRETSEGPSLSVAVIQGNIPQGMKWKREYRDSIMDRYESLSREAAKRGPHLVVWPETATPGFVLKDAALLNRMVALIRDLGIPFLVGSAEYPKFGGDPLVRTQNGNTALYFSGQGKVLGQYLKLRLLPLGEYVPHRDLIPWPSFIVPPDKKDWLVPGKEPAIFEAKGVPFGVLICWENIFPDLSRDLVGRGAQFLVNISNEAWFGKSAAPWQILGICRVRAVENRIPMVRATNTGISCFIDPWGRVYGGVECGGESLFVEGVGVAEVHGRAGGTWYTRLGEAPVSAAIAFVSLLVVFEGRSRRGKGGVDPRVRPQ